jgi:hypothetical protein
MFVGKAINKNEELKMKKVLKKYIALVRDSSLYYKSEIVKTWDEKDYDIAANTYVRNEGVNVSSYGNMQFPCYSLIKMTEYKEHGVTYTDKSAILRNFALKKDTIEKYKLTEVDDYLNEKHLWPIYRMLNEFSIPYINIKTVSGDTKHYTDFDKLKTLVEVVNVKQQPLVIEGTDWPYWFNFEGNLIPSNTSNWFRYLQTKFNYISPASLVPYTGDDMCNKYLSSKVVNIGV